MSDDLQVTTSAQASAWEIANPLLSAMYGEFKEFSKKKPDGAVSKAKIRVVNRLLQKCREVLEDQDSLAFLDLLDEDEVPQNSDVVLTLSQYSAAMEQFRDAHHGWTGGAHQWKFSPDE